MWRVSLSAHDKPKPPLRDRLIPWYFVMAFAVVFAVNGVFVIVAVKNNSGLITENPYEKGLAYNRTIEKADIQDALGWQSTVDYHTNTLRFTLRDQQNRSITGVAAKASITRPLESGHELTLPLTEQKEGIYEAEVAFPLSGQWEITVNAVGDNRHYQTTERLMVR